MLGSRLFQACASRDRVRSAMYLRPACLLVALWPCTLMAADFVSSQNGPFDAPSTWQLISGTDADGVPDADDTATILAGHEVTVRATAEISSIAVAGKLLNQGPVTIRLFNGRLYVLPGGELDLQGSLTHQGSVETAIITSGNLVTLQWQSPPFDPTTVAVGAKLMFLDWRDADGELSREAWHMYEVTATSGDSITYSLGDATNPVLGERINNIVGPVNWTPPPGSRYVQMNTSLPVVNGYVGKFLEFPHSGNQYLVVGNDALSNTVELYDPLRPEDANLTALTAVLHNGVRAGDRFVIFEPSRVESPDRNSEILVDGPARLTLRYVELRGLRQRSTSEFGALRIRNIDGAAPNQRLDVSFVDIRECNSISDTRPAVLLSNCRNCTLSRVNVHDPAPSAIRTGGVRLSACTGTSLVESRVYRLQSTGYEDFPAGSATGQGTQISRCLIHDILYSPPGSDTTDGINYNATKAGLISDTAVLNTGHMGIVFHSAEQFPNVPDPLADALARGCVVLRCFDHAILYSSGNLHPGRDVHAVDCVFGYGGRSSVVYLSSVRYCVLRDSAMIGEYGTPLVLGSIFARHGFNACAVGYPAAPALIQSCLFYNNRGLHLVRHWYDALASRVTIRDSTLVGPPLEDQRCISLERYPPGGGEVVNNILARNWVGIGFYGSGTNTITNDYNLFHDIRLYSVQNGVPGPNSLFTDPLFADIQGEDFRLLPGSPALGPVRRGAHHAGNLVRSWAMKVLGIQAESHRDGKVFNDLDGNGVTDYGNVRILGRRLEFQFPVDLPVVWPNSELLLRVQHLQSGRRIEAVVPVELVDGRTFAVTEETFGMLYQYVDLTGQVLTTLTHVGSPTNPGTGVSAVVPQTFFVVPYRLHDTPPTGGDFDGDGDVDLSDFTQFQLCFGGSSNPPAPTCPPGVNADLDGDGDVDLADFIIFQQNFTGSL